MITEKIKNSVEQLKGLKCYLTEIRKCLHEEQSKGDKEVSDLYHRIEFENFNAKDGYCLAKALKVALVYRRTIKENLSVVQSMTDGLDRINVIKN